MSKNSASSPSIPLSALPRNSARMLASRNTPSSAMNGRLRCASTLPMISATAASRTRSLDRYRGHWNSSENISRSFPVQVQRVTSPFAVVGDILHLVRRPVLEFEIVRHHPGAFLQLLIEHRLNFVDKPRQQINRDQVPGTVVLLQQIPVDDVRVLFQVQFQDLVRAQLAQILVQFHPDRVRMELLRGHDHDAPVARPEIVHLLPSLQAAELQHLLYDGFRSRVVWRQLLGAASLCRRQSS